MRSYQCLYYHVMRLDYRISSLLCNKTSNNLNWHTHRDIYRHTYIWVNDEIPSKSLLSFSLLFSSFWVLVCFWIVLELRDHINLSFSMPYLHMKTENQYKKRIWHARCMTEEKKMRRRTTSDRVLLASKESQ